MLRFFITVFVYLVVLAPVGWLLWHISAGWPLVARLSMEGAFVLGLVDGRRRRRAHKPQTFRDFVD
jgi:hypothetical protein